MPALGPRDVLVYVMAAGVNYNNVWAAMGIPIDVIKARQKKGEPEDFHIGGSDASGVVWAVGKDVTNVKVGDEVVVHCGMWEPDDPWVVAGKDPMLAPSQKIWGYESNWGSFAQYTQGAGSPVRAQAGAPDLGSRRRRTCWSARPRIACCTAGRRTSCRPGDPVLVWGGAGGLGSMAIQIARAAGGAAGRGGRRATARPSSARSSARSA